MEPASTSSQGCAPGTKTITPVEKATDAAPKAGAAPKTSIKKAGVAVLAPKRTRSQSRNRAELKPRPSVPHDGKTRGPKYEKRLRQQAKKGEDVHEAEKAKDMLASFSNKLRMIAPSLSSSFRC